MDCTAYCVLCLPVSPDSVRLAGWKVVSPGAPDIALKKSQTMDIRVDKLFQLPYQGVSYIVACNGSHALSLIHTHTHSFCIVAVCCEYIDFHAYHYLWSLCYHSLSMFLQVWFFLSFSCVSFSVSFTVIVLSGVCTGPTLRTEV